MKDTSPQTYRSSTKGKLFSRNERINIVNSQRAVSARNALRHELVALAKKEIAIEKELRDLAFAKHKALIANPAVKKINQKKNGDLFFQPRINGKIQPAIIVGKSRENPFITSLNKLS
jgi:hypothetical protein